jgi:Putative Actinobacterial Holin-X, holin superfamily III
MNGTRGISDIFADIVESLGTLVRKEMQLARTEVSDKIGEMGNAVAVVAVGGVLALAALIFLLQALVEVLIRSGLSPAVSNLIVAGVVGIVGAIVVSTGISRLRARTLVPERTIESLNRDAAVAKSQMHLSPKHSESTP